MKRLAIIAVITTVVSAVIFAGEYFFPNNKIFRSLTSPIYNIIDPVNIKEGFAEIHNRYRLKPDGRVLDAVGEIHNFLTGEEKMPTEVVMTEEGWNIIYGKDKSLVGSLPDLPNFKDYHNFLTQWAQRIIITRNITFSAPEPATAPPITYTYNIAKLIRTLQEDGYKWQMGNRSPALLEQALVNYTTLAMISIDALQKYDVLEGRPLAFLILTQTADNKPHIREEALLAKTMGYTTHANNLSSQLQQGSARWYIENNVIALRKIAQEAKASEEVLLYTLLSIAKLDRADSSLFSLIKNKFNDDNAIFPALKAVTMQHKFEVQRELPSLLRYTMYQPLPSLTVSKEKKESQAVSIISILTASTFGNYKSLPATVSTFVKWLMSSFYYDTEQFVQHVNAQAKNNRIGFVTEEYYAAFFTAPFYSSFYIEANHYLYGLASQPALRALADNLSRSNSSFLLSFADLLNVINNIQISHTVDTSLLRGTLSNSPLLGQRSLTFLYDQAAKLYKFDDFDQYDVVHDLAQKLDSRPGMRTHFAWILQSNIYDLRMIERYLRGELEIAKEDNLAAELLVATMSGNMPDVKKLLFLPNLSSRDRYFVFKVLAASDSPKHEIRELFAEGVRIYPHDWEIRDNYLEFLMEQKDYPAVIRTAQEWINQNQSERGFPFIFAKLKMATAYYNMKDYEDAIKTLRPVASSGQGGVLNRMALILDRLGQTGDAEKVFKEARERYPDSLYLIQGQMGFLWRIGRYAEAANNFNTLVTIGYSTKNLRETAELFTSALGNNEQNALKAFAEFDKLEIHPEKQNFFTTLIRELNPHLAFALRQPILGKVNGPNKGYILIDAYNDLVKAQGEQYALAWLKYNTPPQIINKIAVPIYEDIVRYNRDSSLLWTLIERPDPNDDPEYVWLVRTATSARKYFGDGKKDLLLAHYKPLANSTNDYDRMARYILGLEKIEMLYPIAESNPKKLGEVAYFIAVKALSERDYATAQDWMMLAISSKDKSNRELNWVIYILGHWRASGKFLGYQTTSE